MQLRAPGEWRIQVTGMSTVGELPILTGSFIIADGTTVTTLPRQTSGTTVPPTTTVPGGTTVPGTGTTLPGATTTLPGG
jgi:hypothetical protein